MPSQWRWRAALALGSTTAALLWLSASPDRRPTDLPAFPCPPPYTSHAALAPGLAVCEAALRLALPPPGTPPLLHTPDVTTLRRPARVVADMAPCGEAPRHSLVVSAHNAAGWLRPNLESLLRTASGPFELIVVLDDCSDASADAALGALGAATRALVRFRLVEQPDAVWETSSDNLGLRLASPQASHAVLVQADMVFSEQGWNERLALPTTLWSDVWAASARAAHNAAAGRFEQNHTAGRSLDEQPAEGALGAAARVFSIRDAVNRGPVALRADTLRRLGRVCVCVMLFGGEKTCQR